MFPTVSLLFLSFAAAASCTTQVEFLLLVFAEPQLDFFCFCFFLEATTKIPEDRSGSGVEHGSGIEHDPRGSKQIRGSCSGIVQLATQRNFPCKWKFVEETINSTIKNLSQHYEQVSNSSKSFLQRKNIHMLDTCHNLMLETSFFVIMFVKPVFH